MYNNPNKLTRVHLYTYGGKQKNLIIKILVGGFNFLYIIHVFIANDISEIIFS